MTIKEKFKSSIRRGILAGVGWVNPFEVRRFLKMRAMEILKNIAFMDFIAMDHACVSL